MKRVFFSNFTVYFRESNKGKKGKKGKKGEKGKKENKQKKGKIFILSQAKSAFPCLCGGGKVTNYDDKLFFFSSLAAPVNAQLVILYRSTTEKKKEKYD